MTIKARFAGQCGECGGAVAVGERVEWEPGQKGVRHAKCPAKPAPAAQKGAGYGKSWTATRTGKCAACSSQVVVGQAVRYRYDEQAAKHLEHVDCATAAKTCPATTTPTRKNGLRPNRRPGSCHDCGCRVPAGAGVLFYCDGDANGCIEHFDGAYAVLCAKCSK